MPDAEQVARIRQSLEGIFPQGDQERIDAVFASGDHAAILGVLADMARHGDPDEYLDALRFAEYAIHFGRGPRAFKLAYLDSPLVSAVHDALYAPDHTKRNYAIALVGRIGPAASGRRAITAAIPSYLAHHGLEAKRLLQVADRMGAGLGQRRQVLLLATASSWVARWSAAGVIWDDVLYRGFPRGRVPAWARQVLRRLAQDSNRWVREEAHIRLEQERLRRRLTSLGIRRLRGRFRDDPSVTCFATALTTHNFLALGGGRDYDEHLVGAMAAFLEHHRYQRGHLLSDFLAPVAASRGVELTG